MEFAIIAAGEGSRLKNEGFRLPKPLLSLMGKPMIHRLINIFANQGAKKVYIMINAHSPELHDYLKMTEFDVPIVIYVKDTESSLHTLHALIEENPLWEVCCVTTTDTVFSESDFSAFLNRYASQQEIDAYMAVTDFVDDESPLYVGLDESDRIKHFADDRILLNDHVSGGIYILGKKSLDYVRSSIQKGNYRMRNYQRDLLDANLLIRGYLFGKIIDVDRLIDRDLAEQFLRDIGEHLQERGNA